MNIPAIMLLSLITGKAPSLMNIKPFIYISLLIITICSWISCKKDNLKWAKTTTISLPTNANLYRMIRTYDNTIIVCGGKRFESAELVISRDNGNTWQHILVAEAGKAMMGLCQSEDSTIYAIGVDSKLLTSEDDGKTWKFTQLNIWNNCTGIAFPTPSKGYTITDIAQRNGAIYSITNKSSTSATKEFQFGLNDIFFNKNVGVAIGYGAVLKTTDTGNTWHYTDIKNDNFSAIYYLNNNNIWLCGAAGGIYQSTDQGKSWQVKRKANSLTQSKYYLRDIAFVNETTGWAVGENGMVIYTSNSGNDWTMYEKFTDNTLRCILPLSDGSVLICGDNGGLYHLQKQ